MHFFLFAAAAAILSPVCATFGPGEGGDGWPSYDTDWKHSKLSKTYWNHYDDGDKYGYHESKKYGWSKTHAPKSYQTYHIPKTHSTTPSKETTVGTPPSYTMAPPQPSTETVASSTIPVVVVPTPQPATSLVPAKTTKITPSTTAPAQQGNTTVPSPPIFTGGAVTSTSQAVSLLVTLGASWLAILLHYI